MNDEARKSKVDRRKIRVSRKILPIEISSTSDITNEHAMIISSAVTMAFRLAGFFDDYIKKAKTEGKPQNIMPRSAAKILSGMESKKVFVCEQVVDGELESIVAASILWEEDAPIPDPNGYRGYALENLLEIGTQISPVLPGFQLQWMLTAITIMNRLVTDPTGMICTATFSDNPVQENFRNTMKFKEWDDIPATIESMRINHLDRIGMRHRGAKWFRPTLDTVNAAAQFLMNLTDCPRRTPKIKDVTTKTADEIHLSFDTQSLEWTALLDASKKIAGNPVHSIEDIELLLEIKIDRNMIYLG